MGVIHPRLELVGAEIFTNFCFLSIILAPDMLERHSRLPNTRGGRTNYFRLQFCPCSKIFESGSCSGSSSGSGYSSNLRLWFLFRLQLQSSIQL